MRYDMSCDWFFLLTEANKLIRKSMLAVSNYKPVLPAYSTAVLPSVRRKAELGGNIWRNLAEYQDDRQLSF